MSYFELREYYRLRGEFEDTLKTFRTLKAIWKASVLIGIEDSQTGDAAIETWDRLRALTERLNRLHLKLGIPGSIFELDESEIEENVTEGSMPEIPWT